MDRDSGFPPLDLQVKEDFPPFHKVRSRPVNPRLYEHAKKEFDRLTGYMYRHSTSPWASPLVIAPKATKPFIRFYGDKVLLPYSKDLSSSVQFEEFVYADPQLFPLQFSAADAPKRITAMKREPIHGIQLHDTFYLDLRYWGYDWFDGLDLPDAYATTYVVLCEYVAWQTRGRYRYVQVRCPLFDEILHTLWHYYYVYVFGSVHALTDAHTLVDEPFCLLYPDILPVRNRDQLYNEFAARN